MNQTNSAPAAAPGEVDLPQIVRDGLVAAFSWAISEGPAGVITITRAVATIIQAVSPVFKTSPANAEEHGKNRLRTAIVKPNNFIRSYPSFV